MDISQDGLETFMGFASKGAEMGLQSAFATAQAKRNAQIQTQMMKEQNELLRRNFQDSEGLAKAGKIASGLNPLGDFNSSNISPSFGSAGESVSYPAESAYSQAVATRIAKMQANDQHELTQTQKDLVAKDVKLKQIQINRLTGEDDAYNNLKKQFPLLNFDSINIKNKGVFDAISNFESLQRQVINNKDANEFDKMHYETLLQIQKDPQKKAIYENSVLAGFEAIKLANDKIMAEIGVANMSVSEMIAKIKLLNEQTISETIKQSLDEQQIEYLYNLSRNLRHQDDWTLLEIIRENDSSSDEWKNAVATLAIRHGNIDNILPKLIDLPVEIVRQVLDFLKFKKVKDAIEDAKNTPKPDGKTSTTERFDKKGNFVGGSTTTTHNTY